MSFITYSLNYYKSKLNEFDTKILSENEILEAKRMLKMLDDLVDEGYSVLYDEIEKSFHGISGLKKIIKANGGEPFALDKTAVSDITYSQAQAEITAFSDKLMRNAEQAATFSANPFIPEVADFCKWLSPDNGEACVFLLRDAFLPYLWFYKQERTNLFPWIIGRSFMEKISPGHYIDDVVRSSFFDALENGCNDFASFKQFSKDKILHDLRAYPEVESTVRSLLSTIDAEKILVIESGIYGTFPMLLAALDERVDFKMFTTVPYLTDIYGERIYTKAYEKNRLFETLNCQDRLFRLSGFADNHFFVNETEDDDIIYNAVAEIRTFLATQQ